MFLPELFHDDNRGPQIKKAVGRRVAVNGSNHLWSVFSSMGMIFCDVEKT